MTELTPQFLDTPPGFPDVLIDGRALREPLSTFQPGVFGPGDLKVTPGPGLSVDVQAGRAIVPGTIDAPWQGNYSIGLSPFLNSNAFETGGLGAADPNLDRIAQIVARVYDHQEDGSGETKWRLQVLAGVPTGGATLDNRAGATPVLPPNSLRIADVRIRPAAAAITAADIRDRRPWAYGAHWAAVGTNAGDATTTSTAFIATSVIPAFRLELSGAPVHVLLTGRAYHEIAGATAFVGVLMDGVVLGSASALSRDVNEPDNFTFFHPFTPTPGSHLFQLAIQSSSASGTATLDNSGGRIPRLSVREILAPATNNG